MAAGNRGGFNPFRDKNGEFAEPGRAGAAGRSRAGGPLQWVALPKAPGGARTGAAPTPKSYGSDYTPETARALREAEDRIREADVEYGVIISADGRVLLDKRGREASISFTKAEQRLLVGAIITHNHPAVAREGLAEVSFSGADIISGFASGESEVRAVTKHYNHVIQWRRSDGQPLNRALTEEEKVDIYFSVSDAYDEFDRAAPLAQQGRQREAAIHRENLLLAQKFGYIYYREDLRTGERDGHGI